MYRIDKLASICACVGAASIYSQSHLLEEMGMQCSNTTIREEESRKGEG
jgi:hypothetical protein